MLCMHMDTQSGLSPYGIYSCVYAGVLKQLQQEHFPCII